VHYVSMYLTCQKVKAEYKKSASLLQLLLMPQWKWEYVNMDFVCGLPISRNKKDVV
jgi:hypothetical protein